MLTYLNQKSDFFLGKKLIAATFQMMEFQSFEIPMINKSIINK